MKTVLAISGSDPSGGAGLEMDLKVIAAYGLHGLSAATALTVQNSKGVESVNPVSSKLLKRRLEVLYADLKIDVVKIGALNGESTMKAVAAFLEKKMLPKNIPVVIDPVFKPTSGMPFMNKSNSKLFKSILLPLATIVTPNLEEAAELSGYEVKNTESMKIAAAAIRASGPKAVLVKGGHLKGEPKDVLLNVDHFVIYRGSRVKGSFHGTGCTLSSAIASGLASGFALDLAVRKAKVFLTRSMKKGYQLGAGSHYLNISPIRSARAG